MMQLVKRLVIALSLVLVVAVAGCGESKDGDPLANIGGFGGAPKAATPDQENAKDGAKKPGEATKPSGLGDLGATPPVPTGAQTTGTTPTPGITGTAAAPATGGIDFSKEVDRLADQAAKQATATGEKAGGTLGNLPGLTGGSAPTGLTGGPAPTAGSRAPITTAQGLVRLGKLERTACRCRSRSCGKRALNTFRALFDDIKYLNARKDVLDDVKARSTRITTCLIKSGVTGPEVMAIFTGAGAKAATTGSTAAPGSAAALVAQFETMTAQACACKDKSCATRALGQLAAYYALNKTVKTTPAQYTRIKNSSATLARCLMQNGISPKTIQAVFK